MQEHDVTATRHTLSEEWRASRSRLDWMHAPEMAGYVNGLVSGRPLHNGGHWALHALREHVAPLHQKRTREAGLFRRGHISLLSLGCGSGHIESSLIDFGWPVSRIIGLEYDELLREHAARSFAEKYPDVEASFLPFDFNRPAALQEQFDIVFCCHSIHHATDLESFLPAINSYLKEDGLFIGLDFFGPTRFQIEPEVREILEELFAALPDEQRRDLRYDDGPVARRFEVDTIVAVRSADESESVRSSDLRTLLFANFPIIETKPMGGTLLRWLLQYRAGNFRSDNPAHVTIVKLLQIIEREMIASRRIRSDDLFFVLGKSTRF